MPSPTVEQILANADLIDKDADILHEASHALARRGAPQRLVKEIQSRRDEWWEQATEMRRRVGVEGGQI